MDSFASWKMNDSGMENEERKREETPLQGEDECHTLILFGDHCLLACDLRLTTSKCLTPIVVEFVMNVVKELNNELYIKFNI